MKTSQELRKKAVTNTWTSVIVMGLILGSLIWAIAALVKTGKFSVLAIGGFLVGLFALFIIGKLGETAKDTNAFEFGATYGWAFIGNILIYFLASNVVSGSAPFVIGFFGILSFLVEGGILFLLYKENKDLWDDVRKAEAKEKAADK